MDTVNKSTGFSGFQLKMGWSPRLLPPLIDKQPALLDEDIDAVTTQQAIDVIYQLELNILESKDNLIYVKVFQLHQANKSQGPKIVYKTGDLIMLSTLHCRRDYKNKGDKRVAKSMPRFDSPYRVVAAFPESSVYTLDLPNSPNTFPTFHASELMLHYANDAELFPH
jgi:hypothetical protein